MDYSVDNSADSAHSRRQNRMPNQPDGAIPNATPGARPRLESIDILRGIIMILMAVDHVRDYFSHELLLFFPLDLTKTYPAMFMTRWMTNFCAPLFCLLAGTGAFLSFRRGKSKNDLARFLLTRGLWLVLLELTVIRCLGWNFDFNYHITGLQVIWALGWSMVVLAGLIYLPRWLIAAFVVLMIGGHNLLDRFQPADFGAFAWLWHVLHVPGPIAPSGRFQFIILYPLVPWIAVMALGYLLGPLFEMDAAQRRRRLMWWGLGLTAAFIVIRAANGYGNPRPWQPQKSALFTVFDFINCLKYPPSLLYVLMTVGPGIAALALLDRARGKWFHPLVVIGRVPLFFYILHIALIHALAIALSYATHGRTDWLWGAPWGTNIEPPPDYGYSLAGVYVIWAAIVLALYPACAWFAAVKQRRREAWLSYL